MTSRPVSALADKLPGLDRLWTGLGMPDHGLWAPGLPPAQVRQALAGIVEDVPAEVVDWFAWHNGWDPEPLMKPAMAPCFYDPYPLADALDARRTMMASAQTVAGFDTTPEYWWPPTWLPFGTDDGGGYLVVNLAEFQGLPVGVVYAPNWEDREFREPVASSLNDMVDVWLELLPTGMWTWNAGEGHWESRYDHRNPSVPEHLRRRDIME